MERVKIDIEYPDGKKASYWIPATLSKKEIEKVLRSMLVLLGGNEDER